MDQIEIPRERLLAAVRLDPTKDKAVVFPPEKGAHFHQDGFYFDFHGALAPDMLTSADEVRLRKLLNKRAVKKQMERTKIEFMKEHGLSPEDLEDSDAVITAVVTSTIPVDIVGWARAEVKYPFHRVIDFMRDKYQFEGHDIPSVINYLIEKEIVAEGAVRIS